MRILVFLFSFFFDVGYQRHCISEPFTKESVESALTAEILQQIPAFTLTLNHFQQSWENLADLSLKVTALTLTPQKTFRATVTHGETTKVITGKITRKITIPVVNQALGSDDVIQESHVTLHECDDDIVNGHIIVKHEDLIGLKVRKNRLLKPYTPISLHDVEKPLLVKRGDTVRVSYKDPAFEISVTAIAKNNGSKGDLIPFEVSSSKKIVQGIITQQGQAEIRAS